MTTRLVPLACLALLLTGSIGHGQAPATKQLADGLKTPESVCVGPDKRIYISVMGKFGEDGDGSIAVIGKDGKTTTFATGLDDPKGMVWKMGGGFGKFKAGPRLYVTDKTRVMQIDLKGKVEVFVEAKDFPHAPLFLNDIEADGKGNLYVSDSGDLKGGKGAIFKIAPNKKITVLADPTTMPAMKTPNGLLMDGQYFLLMLDFGSGELHRINLADGKSAKVADGFGGGDGLAWDHYGRLYISDWKDGRLFVIPRPGQKAVQIPVKFGNAADICLSPNGRDILVPDMKAGTVTAVPIGVPGQPVDESALPVRPAKAFPKLKWTGWTGEGKGGKPEPLRPLVLTHANDSSNRVFVATQHGVIHVFPNDQKATETKVFLDIRAKVAYSDKTNEEGFLGLCFHPDYKKNGEFFVYYTPRKASKKGGNVSNIVARYRVSKDDPNKADMVEEILLEIPKPFWNHDGGTIVFGPDGFLYIAIGDGGARDDPFNNGQDLNSLLGKVLRIDVNGRSAALPYRIPPSNPFEGRKGARGEVWAYGLRNIWRMSFDTKTGKLWAGEVGQDLYEEINIIEKGGNYGWKLRESLHPFSVKGVDANKDMIEPIWEYHHDVGKSITGGHVYRGKRLPELDGYYLYADYVTNRIWALKYDEKLGRVTENRTIRDIGQAIVSFGEDERGEVYFLIVSGTGEGLYWFDRNAPAR